MSPSRAGQVLDDLAALGVVERRAAGSHVAVRMIEENVTAQWVTRLARLWRSALDGMRVAAAEIRPAPLSLVVFGSFARGAALPDSDVDVLAVHSNEIDEESHTASSARWVQTLGEWADIAGRIAGNPVSLIDLALDEIAMSRHDRFGTAAEPAWLVSAAREGIVLVGGPIRELRRREAPGGGL